MQVFDILAAGVFAASGALVASRTGMDVMGLDAFGLALVTVAGTAKALEAGAPAIVAVAMGAVTGSVGGIIRDTLGHVPSVLLGHEVYVTASVLGGCTYVGCQAAGVERSSAMVVGFVVTAAIRGLAIRFGWSLPVFGSRRSVLPPTRAEKPDAAQQ